MALRSSPTATRRRAEHDGQGVGIEEALDQGIVAEISSAHITRMTRGELVRMVGASPMPTAPPRLEYLDRPTLERLAHLACLSCRQRNQ